MSNVDILEKFYREVWEEGKTDRIDQYFQRSEASGQVIPIQLIDSSEINEWVTVLRSFVTDIQVHILHTVENDDWLGAMLKMTCRDASSGAPVSVHQQIMLRFEAGKMVEYYPQLNLISFFEQLGQLPEDVDALLLGGAQLD